MPKEGNCVVAQSGGPTAVINASLLGVIEEAMKQHPIRAIYGAKNGIIGLIDEELYDLRMEDPEELKLLKTTPSSALGSCRYQLKPFEHDEKDYIKIFNVFEAHNIRYFFYIGGNDSMDTADKLTRYAQKIGYDICIIGIPKTIDNDLVMTDHCPGFGSAAKYIATSVMEIARDAIVYPTNIVTIIEVMGRNAGWLAAASALASKDIGAPDLIYLPEVPFSIDKFLDDVRNIHKKTGKITIVVSEGIKDKEGKYIADMSHKFGIDAFGHVQLGGAAFVLENIIREEVEKRVKSIQFNVLQRSAAHIMSKTDVEEAYMVGRMAVRYAVEGACGYMVAIKRDSDNPYSSSTELVELNKVANAEKLVPLAWISHDGNYVKEDALNYIQPLIEGEVEVKYEKGLPRYAKLRKIMVPKKVV
ncbi:6-phosphofructokinase [Caldicellulosiruptor bescii]|uniref:Pyrophosphate--fructose 6-phosphate 1-phosphotransferase n=2 Tax=Caldicellulosiruptor bescii TaxID=31899 RepID=B9MKQ9_CALBD|nr:6-phosphofructokinase [Caldicellulosiruptor bescii]ACM60917.1 phosphofructokinase [Caldicellulosiruptor bescii DSM 6725]PBC89265.1 6-phosphofructokinase [Caldicellulosiruptor bescii]PBC91250.1 6-phosphofructokinase [Caldicellulosiruptor bescii]PBD03336.1 6-phosphofructokinase [Caldicellulosiruptor bescii]PBD07049.1 6-phosphofructokinase [Caldicellulosiruptor bescii]